MGLTIVQKSDLSRPKPNPKIALVLAGGAITGGTFKVGGLKALNDFLVNRKVTDFDIYVGASAGGFLAAALAGGITPEEMLKSLDGSSKLFSQLSPWHIYQPNWLEFAERPLRFFTQSLAYLPRLASPLFQRPPKGASPNLKEILQKRLLEIPSLWEMIPSGFFDNGPLEKYLRKNMKRNRIPNDFTAMKKKRGKSLYVVTTNLDTAERVIFGPDEKNDVTISKAVQASTAVPLLYKPVRIQGVDYTDGAVRRTTNMDVAIQKKAELIICYNPFRPYSNKLMLQYLKEEGRYVAKNRYLSSHGLLMILNQVFRTILHTRIRYFIDQIRVDPNFKGDLILIEPHDDDSLFFGMNPMSFWDRAKAASHGFTSVRNTILSRFGEVSKILAAYGITMSRDLVDKDYSQIRKTRNDAKIMKVLEKDPARRLRIVKAA
ncbi:MAG: patatin-like phospholipase family protein [Deltaproteobacteria bacterium]|nr:patatin-like phospholipase family protein [Deltaproteobacteria bacterium]